MLIVLKSSCARQKSFSCPRAPRVKLAARAQVHRMTSAARLACVVRGSSRACCHAASGDTDSAWLCSQGTLCIALVDAWLPLPRAVLRKPRHHHGGNLLSNTEASAVCSGFGRRARQGGDSFLKIGCNSPGLLPLWRPSITPDSCSGRAGGNGMWYGEGGGEWCRRQHPLV